MAEEFQESEVIFPENAENKESDWYNFPTHSNSGELGNIKLKRKKNKKKKNSLPVNIPENGSGNSWFQYVNSDFFEEDEYDEEEMEPPHVILARRLAGKMAFSVCTGNGRTLKGRDLSEVRNSILRMTGFLET